jgi:hypothetical protein
MLAGRTIPDPDARELRACVLAALGEAGVVALPAYVVLVGSGAIDVGIWAFLLACGASFVLGTLLLCRFRASPNATLVAAVTVALVGIRVGWSGGLYRLLFVLVVSLLVTVRVVTLALRDWRTPYQSELAWFALALGLEVLIPTDPVGNWKPALIVVIPLFFFAALASRATTVWTSGAIGDLDERIRSGWLRRALLATGALAAAMLSVVAMGVRGGLLEGVGALVSPIAGALAVLLTWILWQLARPLIWLADLVRIDPEAARRFLERLRRNAGELDRRVREPGSPAIWMRLLGFVVLALVVVGLIRLIRRFRPHVSVDARAAEAPAPIASAPIELEAPCPGRPWYRRELPVDRVRRWYAESLIELERLRMPKDPALTPTEFEVEVSGALPRCAEGFRALTRAYEDVRYGNLTLSRVELRALEERAEHLLHELRRARALSPEEPSDGSS